MKSVILIRRISDNVRPPPPRFLNFPIWNDKSLASHTTFKAFAGWVQNMVLYEPRMPAEVILIPILDCPIMGKDIICSQRRLQSVLTPEISQVRPEKSAGLETTSQMPSNVNWYSN